MSLFIIVFIDPSPDEAPPVKRLKTESLSHDQLSPDQSIKVSQIFVPHSVERKMGISITLIITELFFNTGGYCD